MIRDAFNDVLAFHRAHGLPVGEEPGKLARARAEERWDMLREELGEIARADESGTIAQAVAERLDAIYFLLGDIVEMGVDPEPIWQEIQRANMAKTGGPIVDGKLQKPDGWEPPDIEAKVVPLAGQECYANDGDFFCTLPIAHCGRHESRVYGALCHTWPQETT